MHWGYVLVGYLFVFGGLGVYIASMLTKAKRLAAQVPEERRRFLD